MKKMILTSVILFFLGIQPVNAAIFNLYGIGDRSDFVTALGGAPFISQDFESYAVDTDLDGVEFLPGVSVTSNADIVEVWGGIGDQELFALDGTTRMSSEDLYYDIHLGSYNAVGFDIDAYDPYTPGPGIMEIFFSDGTSSSINIFPTNLTEDDPVFFGVISDVFIDSIRWTEGPELGGSGNEETALDNFLVANANTAPVPEPATLFLLGTGLVGLAGAGRKRLFKK